MEYLAFKRWREKKYRLLAERAAKEAARVDQASAAKTSTKDPAKAPEAEDDEQFHRDHDAPISAKFREWNKQRPPGGPVSERPRDTSGHQKPPHQRDPVDRSKEEQRWKDRTRDAERRAKERRRDKCRKKCWR